MWAYLGRHLIDLLTLTIAGVGVGLGLRQLRLHSRQQNLELSHLYLQRYWEIDDSRLMAGENDTVHRHRYLILCEDEYDAARGKWLDMQLWEEWHSWLARTGSRPRLESDLEAVADGEKNFEHLRACLATPAGHPWRECGAALGS